MDSLKYITVSDLFKEVLEEAIGKKMKQGSLGRNAISASAGEIGESFLLLKINAVKRLFRIFGPGIRQVDCLRPPDGQCQEHRKNCSTLCTKIAHRSRQGTRIKLCQKNFVFFLSPFVSQFHF
jgi:hypothetical protein